MNPAKPFTTVAAVIFLIIALIHLYRLVAPFEVVIGACTIPQWFSAIGLLIAGLLSAMLFREARR